MEGLICLGVIIGIFGTACLIGWGMGALYDIYYKYRVKKNHTNHPKLIGLQKERERMCKEYSQWWDEKYEAQKRIDKYMEETKYHEEDITKSFLEAIKQEQQIYSNADKHMKELSPLVNAAREAEQTYREEHNIRHW